MPMWATSSARTMRCWPAASISAPPRPEKVACGVAAAELGDDLGAVVVAGGFAGGEEDGRVGGGGDGISLDFASEGLDGG